eukprot:COSAG02_NODE_25088_length_669_cov_1.070175_1_plen_82_part_10
MQSREIRPKEKGATGWDEGGEREGGRKGEMLIFRSRHTIKGASRVSVTWVICPVCASRCASARANYVGVSMCVHVERHLHTH